MVVPVWSEAAGVLEAADLIHAGIVARVAILADPPKPAQREFTRRGIPYDNDVTRMTRLLTSLGVVSVETIPNGAAGTEAEGDVLPSWCDEQHFHSIIVVSTPDHSRRLSRVLRRSMNGHPIRVTVRPARYAVFDPNQWWRTHDGIRIEMVELEKLILDLVRHPVSKG